jgi:hypothetical protein
VSELLQQTLPGSTLVVAVDPGKAQQGVWFSTGDVGLLVEPLTVSALRPGLDEVTGIVQRLVGSGSPVVAIEFPKSTSVVGIRAEDCARRSGRGFQISSKPR